MANAPTKKSATALLGLALDGNRLEFVAVKRSNGSVDIRQAGAVTLSLDPLTNEPELVGAEIRKHLDAAGVRDKRCVVCVPLNWALTQQVKVPAGLAPQDIESLVQVEAERGFPYSPDALMLSRSFLQAAGGEQTATLVAIPRDHALRLQQTLEAAGLRPLSFSLGIAALQPVSESVTAAGVLALVAGEKGVGLQMTAVGGVAALRTLEGAYEQDGNRKRVQADYISRELRITLGQLPAEARALVRHVRIFGRGELAQELFDQVRPRAEALGMRAQLVKDYAPNELEVHLAPETAVSPALSLAVRHLTGKASVFEFLPPKVSRWALFMQQYSSQKLVYSGATLAVLALAVGVAFGWQQWELTRLNAQWDGMKVRVTAVDEMQGKIRKYRPWFDDSFRSLSILRKLTEAFPEDGSVSAKSVELREPATITCSGTARSNQAWLKMLDQLRSTKEISDVKVEHIKGGNNGAPLEFTFNFHWGSKSGGIR